VINLIIVLFSVLVFSIGLIIFRAGYWYGVEKAERDLLDPQRRTTVAPDPSTLEAFLQDLWASSPKSGSISKDDAELIERFLREKRLGR